VGEEVIAHEETEEDEVVNHSFEVEFEHFLAALLLGLNLFTEVAEFTFRVVPEFFELVEELITQFGNVYQDPVVSDNLLLLTLEDFDEVCECVITHFSVAFDHLDVFFTVLGTVFHRVVLLAQAAQQVAGDRQRFSDYEDVLEVE